MLSIKEICAQTGISPHTFQFWRRDGSKLLPPPVGVDKKVIFFDDSILERIRFIKEQKAAGKKLSEIEDVFKSYYGFIKRGEVDELKAASLNNILGKLVACDAELKIRLENLQASFQRDLERHERRIKDLFGDFQAALAESNLSAFLAALSANGLGCLDKTLADENPGSQEAPTPDREKSSEVGV